MGSYIKSIHILASFLNAILSWQTIQGFLLNLKGKEARSSVILRYKIPTTSSFKREFQRLERWPGSPEHLLETQAQFSAPTWQLTIGCNSSSRGPKFSSDLHEHCTHVVHLYMQVNTYIHKLKKSRRISQYLSVGNREWRAGLSSGSTSFANHSSSHHQGKAPHHHWHMCEHFTYKLSIMGVDVQGLCTFEYRGMNFIR